MQIRTGSTGTVHEGPAGKGFPFRSFRGPSAVPGGNGSYSTVEKERHTVARRVVREGKSQFIRADNRAFRNVKRSGNFRIQGWLQNERIFPGKQAQALYSVAYTSGV